MFDAGVDLVFDLRAVASVSCEPVGANGDEMGSCARSVAQAHRSATDTAPKRGHLVITGELALSSFIACQLDVGELGVGEAIVRGVARGDIEENLRDFILAIFG